MLLILSGFFFGLLIAWANALLASEICLSVSDESSLSLPRARIEVENLKSGAVLAGETNQKGSVCFAGIAEGSYSVSASLDGCLNARYYPVRASYPQRNNLAIRLPLGMSRRGVLLPTLPLVELSPTVGASLRRRVSVLAT
jgi:hypothetical protein